VDLGLDRGTIGDAHLVRFEPAGPRVTLVLENPAFRATGGNEALARSVRESFATSTLGAFDVLAQDGERVLVDATALVLSDVMDVRGALRGQGTFVLGFTLDAVVKAVGGMEYQYAVRGDALPPTTQIPAARQRRALELVLDALQPGAVAVPERVLRLLAPAPFGYEHDAWAVSSAAAPAFDQLGAARALATQVIGGVLAPARAARVAAFHDRDAREPSLTEVVGRIVERTWVAGGAARTDHPALGRVVQRVVVDQLIALASDERATPESRADAGTPGRHLVRDRQVLLEFRSGRASALNRTPRSRTRGTWRSPR
jgi:hypothetical protein